jgi:hypothetical protein
MSILKGSLKRHFEKENLQGHFGGGIGRAGLGESLWAWNRASL